MKIVIVGGVAGGATAAARIRRLDEKAEIVIFERTGFISYANCGLPYFIGDVINDPDDLTLQSPAGFFRRFRINAKIHHEVVAINPDSKTVTVKNLESGEFFEESYDTTPTDVGSSSRALCVLSYRFRSKTLAPRAFFAHCFRVFRFCLW